MKSIDRQLDASSEGSTDGKNIKVYLRIRPIGLSEIERGSTGILSAVPPQHVIINTPRQSNKTYLRDTDEPQTELTQYLSDQLLEHGHDFVPRDSTPSEHQTPPRQGVGRYQQMFGFDGVFEPQATQIDVFETVGVPIVQSALEGYNTCIIAYGQTGSGKTYSMVGQEGSLRSYVRPFQDVQRSSSSATATNSTSLLDTSLLGIMPRACSMLFDSLDELMRSEDRVVCSYNVELTCVEVYNDVVKCLLDDQAECEVREDPLKGPVVRGAATYCISSADVAFQLLNKAFRRRTSAATNLNRFSSRSHAICTFTIAVSRMKDMTDEQYTTTGAMHLVDLAGSERAYLAHTEGERLREGGAIGRSLLSLGQVIKSLVDDKQHVPYRGSLLTFLLKNALGGNSRTVMLTTVSPSSASYHETLHALHYADRVKSVRNRPHINKTRAQLDMLALRLEIKRLQEDNTTLRREKAMICCPIDAEAALMRTGPVPLPGTSIGAFLRRGFFTVLEVDPEAEIPESRTSMESSGSAADEESGFGNRIIADWTEAGLMVVIPEGWRIERSVHCCCQVVQKVGPAKVEIFHHDTVVFTHDEFGGKHDTEARCRQHKYMFILAGGPEDNAHVCFPEETPTSRARMETPLREVRSPGEFPTKTLWERQNEAESKSPLSEQGECFKIDDSPESASSAAHTKVIEDTIRTLLESAHIRPQTDLPSLVDITHDEETASNSSRTEGSYSPLYGSSTKRLVSTKRQNFPFSKIQLEQSSFSFVIAFDASKDRICVVLEETPQPFESVDIFHTGRLSTGSTDSEDTPIRRSLGEVMGGRPKTILYDLEKFFPYVVLFVNEYLERQTKYREQAFRDIIDDMKKIHANFQQQLYLKNSKENDLLEAAQSGAHDVKEVRKAMEDVNVKLAASRRQVSNLQAEIGEKDTLINFFQKENERLFQETEKNTRIKATLHAEQSQRENLATDLAHSRNEVFALRTDLESLRDEAINRIHTAVNAVCTPPDVSLPAGVDPNCASCENLSVEIADLQTKMHFVEQNRCVAEQNLARLSENKSQSLNTIFALKDEVHSMQEQVNALSVKHDEQITTSHKHQEENAELLSTVQSLMNEKMRQESEFAQMEAKLHEQTAATHEAVRCAVENERRNHAVLEADRNTEEQKRLETQQKQHKNDLIRKIDMMDEKQVMIQKLAHELEEKAKIRPRQPEAFQSPRTAAPYTPRRFDASRAMISAQRTETVPAQTSQRRGRSVPAEPQNPSDSRYDAYAGGDTGDIDRHIMEAKERVDRKLANDKSGSLRADAASMVDALREEMLNATIAHERATQSGRYNQS